ncbi:cytochrome c oxidase subunit 3 (mitochondrion) [Kluyveromyces lactis]|jgi:cytochrome c oxidase subunit 3|uniref:Cytochrome c oxidase subunit 3 n=1 Tax=Kluyveromyces lactis (strain ATCC 8585 / CBS 2359 / DSM 70799 / NBRC 1267 / NRRL Y-1140 / WM37) TaxID=284590 RepID=COX3_KLULA|nr:cytochrome c oxidase subunit 3 [Kluyveromyces lactis]Q9XLW9.2 RecName: Full=Cytochrome c oxidase subunit 3; AltName: Full=Cytochrome c oxidase polypeptide III [Kluyveromyces lactis NRRL Y-1140]AAT64954.1 cytochrome c oxidase subunit 3 [Kluyveromyces lactis]|eukprot:YP_054504.1 cytochrome c oxidase subunit 3 (mitochondrion) [Kluyveromyces lactis]
MTHLERSRHQQFPFHLVAPSPWPIVVSFALMSLALSLALTMHGYIGHMYLIYLSILTVTLSATLWFRDIIAEATYLGDHTIAVRKGINLGFLLFVVSEILIFAALFWAYFHSAMSPNIELGGVWPPVGIQAVQPTELPLLNTIILLSSGATITYSHHGLVGGNRKNALSGLLITFWLIVIFVTCQYIEYTNATFTITDGVYGSVFYAGTGLHFLHMVMLAAMLGINYWRLRNYHLTATHHVGYETTVLYCHILDIIWLFLYIVFYWWGV